MDLVDPPEASPTPPESGGVDPAGLDDQQLSDHLIAAVRARTTSHDEPRRSALGQLLLDLLDEQTRRTTHD